jgi:hypothetical protein
MGGADLLVARAPAEAGHILARHTVTMLDGCRAFRTLPEHAADIERRGRIDRLAALQMLAHAVENRLMLAESECAALAEGTSHPASRRRAAGNIEVVGVATRDRPQLLDRALRSYLQNAEAHDHRPQVVVFDDSTASATRAENRAILARLAASGPSASLAYCGQEEKRQFVEHLRRATGVASRLLEFALLDSEGCGYTLGANRNAMLLHAAGSMVLSVDDDSVCTPAVAADHVDTRRLVLGSESDPAEFLFFTDRHDALACTTWVRRDVLGDHASLLGETVSGLAGAAAAARTLDVEGACGHALTAVRSPQARVLITVTGTLGDSGTGQPAWLMAAPPGATRDRFLASESSYRAALGSREVLRVAPAAAIAHGGTSITTTATGFDNRELLPPFMPVERNQDGLFGAIIGRCSDSAFFGHVPWALLHDPPQARSYLPLSATMGRLQFCDIARASIVGSGERLCGDGAARLGILGAQLRAIGSLPLGSFEELVRGMHRALTASWITRLERALAASRGEPEYWARDARALSTLLRDLSRAKTVPLASIAGLLGTAALAKTQRILHLYGELLDVWPKLVRGAQGLRADGHSMAA